MPRPSKGASKPGGSRVTPGGLIRKVVYLEEAEVEALRRAAFDEVRYESDIMREAISGRLAPYLKPKR